MSFIWQVGVDASVFTHVLFSHYTSPYGIKVEKENELDQEKLELYYKKSRNYFGNLTNLYRGNYLMQLWGNDFSFKEA